jgi:hypothetical protein
MEEGTMHRLLIAMVVSLWGSMLALATPYWVAWEGDDFPENEGWLRVWGDENGHSRAVRNGPSRMAS